MTATFNYQSSDVGGGSNTGFKSQRYNVGWSAVDTGTSDPSGTSTQTSVLPSSGYIGDFAVGKVPTNTPPTLNAYIYPTEDNVSSHPITFTDDTAWRSHISLVTAQLGTGGVVHNLTAGVDYTDSAGILKLIPTTSDNYLTTSGNYTISVYATGYLGTSVIQRINAGSATKLGISVQPAAPTTNGGLLATQPVILIQDQYGNTANSTATVNATVGSGTWTIGGTTSRSGVGGVATFTSLTGTSYGADTAVIQFSSTGLTSVSSNAMILPAPNPPSLTAATGATVDASFNITFTDNPAWRASVTSVQVLSLIHI